MESTVQGDLSNFVRAAGWLVSASLTVAGLWLGSRKIRTKNGRVAVLLAAIAMASVWSELASISRRAELLTLSLTLGGGCLLMVLTDRFLCDKALEKIGSTRRFLKSLAAFAEMTFVLFGSVGLFSAAILICLPGDSSRSRIPQVTEIKIGGHAPTSAILRDSYTITGKLTGAELVPGLLVGKIAPYERYYAASTAVEGWTISDVEFRPRLGTVQHPKLHLAVCALIPKNPKEWQRCSVVHTTILDVPIRPDIHVNALYAGGRSVDSTEPVPVLGDLQGSLKGKVPLEWNLYAKTQDYENWYQLDVSSDGQRWKISNFRFRPPAITAKKAVSIEFRACPVSVAVAEVWNDCPTVSSSILTLSSAEPRIEIQHACEGPDCWYDGIAWDVLPGLEDLCLTIGTGSSALRTAFEPKPLGRATWRARFGRTPVALPLAVSAVLESPGKDELTCSRTSPIQVTFHKLSRGKHAEKED